MTWNLRWLTDPRTAKAQAARALLLQLTDRGAVVLLQKAHWDGDAAATWSSGVLPHIAVVHSLARLGPMGGLQGGVTFGFTGALLLRLAGLKIRNRRTLVVPHGTSTS